MHPVPGLEQVDNGDPTSDKRGVFSLPDFIKKTVLDHGAIKDFLDKSLTDKNTKLAERLKAEPRPVKELKRVETFRQSPPCAAPCEEASKKGRVAQCTQCPLLVYDFTDMDDAEAQKIVTKQEGKENAVFYKRKDGKFLTKPCPVAATRQRNTTIVIVSAVVILGSIAALWLIFGASQLRQDKQGEQEEQPVTTEESTPWPEPQPAATTKPAQQQEPVPAGAGTTGEPAGATIVDPQKPMAMPDGSRWKTTIKGYYKIQTPGQSPEPAKNAAATGGTSPANPDASAQAAAPEAKGSPTTGASPQPQPDSTGTAGQPAAEKAPESSDHGVKYYGHTKP